MPPGISKEEYVTMAARCLQMSLNHATKQPMGAVLTGNSVVRDGVEVTVLVLMDHAERRLGLRAIEAINELTNGQGHGPMQIVERDAPRPPAPPPRTPETHAFPEMESAVSRDVAKKITALLPPLMGWALFTFDFGPGGRLAYASNARREDMIKVTKEWLRHQGETSL